MCTPPGLCCSNNGRVHARDRRRAFGIRREVKKTGSGLGGRQSLATGRSRVTRDREKREQKIISIVGRKADRFNERREVLESNEQIYREVAMAVSQRTGKIASGDVTLFYRAFGSPGATPIMILHGSNYYDSLDWVGIAAGLAADREVVVPDRRGWGESTWSPSKDYSLDALLDDMLAVIGALRWDKVIVMGHSGGGPTVISFSVNFAERTEKLVLVDSQMNREESARTGRSVGNPPYIFESVEAAMANFAKLANPPRIARDRARAEAALVKVERGYMLKRDPDGSNRQPVGEGASLPRRPVREMWAELAMVKCPTLLVRGVRSSRYPAETVARLTREYPQITQQVVDSDHDVPGHVPDALVAHVRKFVGAA
jgi:pimeloyl-ACP methyl ester carboxylesterase